MVTNNTAQRRRASRKTIDRRVVRIQTKDRMGHPRWITGDLIDSSEAGIAMFLTSPLAVSSRIIVRGSFGEDRAESEREIEVRSCLEQNNGSYRIGAQFLDSDAGDTKAAPQPVSIDPKELDCYEILQLSPNADAETIDRVYRLLAQRYHPDNPRTGNSEAFVRLVQAYRVLSDPEQRAGYDAQHRETKQVHWNIFDQTHIATGPPAEKQKRQGILGLLYVKALRDPERATLNIFELEDVLGCPREHLQAALWYLKGKGYVQRTDHGRYSITVQGFDEVEERSVLVNVDDLKLLEAVSKAAS